MASQADLADRHRIEGDALALAVADARSKADLMAGAAGVELGHGRSLSEGYASRNRSRSRSSDPRSPRWMSHRRLQIEPQMIQVDADATIVFSISTRQH